MSQPSVSIVIPAYNAEKYLGRCLDSVRAQTLGGWECIVVNDGSTDGSQAVAEGYAARDSRIRVIAQANAGPSAARNRGTAVVTGQYITYIDADDTIVPTYLEDFGTLGADLLMQGMHMEYADEPGRDHDNAFALEGETDAATAIEQAFANMLILSPCAKLYRRQWLMENDIAFDTALRYGEDRVMVAKAVSKASSVRLSRACGYVYHHDNPVSLTSQARPWEHTYHYVEQYHPLVERLIERCPGMSEAVKAKARHFYLYELIYGVIGLLHEGRRAELRDIDPQILRDSRDVNLGSSLYNALRWGLTHLPPSLFWPCGRLLTSLKR